MLMHCKSVCLSALMKFSPGWCQTGLILPRPRCSNVPPLDVGIRFPLFLLVLVTHLCFQYEQFETLGLHWRRCHHECSRHCNRQSVFNAAARLVFSTSKWELHVTPLLCELHWLKVPGRIQFRLCVLAYHCLNGMATSYLAETLHLTADVGSRRRLRSVSTSTLVVPSTRRTTLHDRAFPVAAARAWNALPPSVRSAPSLLQFRRDLKTSLFQSSYSSP